MGGATRVLTFAPSAGPDRGSEPAAGGAGGASPPKGARLDALWTRFRRRRRFRERNLLVEAHLAVVGRTLRHMRVRAPRHVDRDDLEAAGVFGLVRAVERFDPARGVRFETFAARWIRGAILEEIRRADPWPRRWRERRARLDRVLERLGARLGRAPTESETARALRASVERFRDDFAPLAGRSFALSPPLLRGTDAAGSDPPLVDPASSGALDAIARRDFVGLVLSLVDARERRILRLRYFEDRTMRDIGARLGLDESRICRILSQVHTRLRARLASRAWEAA